ncbi:MAG: sodium:alanine symporter family protein [Holosporaceae bacterium]|jgi:AGCS family alanine or glycine:cation symporter|nr:sodium:alanine symporter family protein [Holosporaceae bacterium]
MNSALMAVNQVVWGAPLVAALLGVGLYFSFQLKFLQITRLKLAIGYIFDRDGRASGESIGDISSFASLCTALSATLGTGNIVGIAMAVAAGGPGAIFWMWVTSFFSIAIKYAEGFLAIKYRRIDGNGQISGGPMYYIEATMKSKFLAKLFALFGVWVACFGIGTLAQTNSIAAAARSFGVPIHCTALVVGILVAVIVIGGIKRIATVSEKIVPFMSIFYMGAAVVVLLLNAQNIPNALRLILASAFSSESVLGGGVGFAVMSAVQMGASRGIFSHESGLGSAAIAAAAAKTKSPVEQGLVSMMGAVFSLIICTMTGMVLMVTCGETNIFNPQCAPEGTLLTSYAFGAGLGAAEPGAHIVNFGILFFAFTTIIGWNYYGEKCIQYLAGSRAVMPYKIFFVFLVAIGPFFNIDAIFTLADIVVGLMAVPNLMGVMLLRNVVIGETRLFFRQNLPKNAGDQV